MPEPVDIAQLGALQDGEVLALVQACPDIQACRFRDGDYLMREGGEDEEIFIVLKGAFVVEQGQGAGAAPAILSMVECEAGNPVIVGEMAHLGGLCRTASIRSVGNTLALVLPPQRLDSLMGGYPGLTRLICQQFARRLKETNATLKELQGRFALYATQRVANPGECLFRRGEPARELLQVVAGLVRLEGPSGSRMVTPEDLSSGLLEPGPFLRGKAQAVTATAEGLCFLAVIPESRREAVVRMFPALVLAELNG